MNILYISQFFFPELNAGSFRAYENSCYWKKEDNNITVITTYPNYPKGKIFEGYTNKLISKEDIDGVNVIRVKSIIKKNNTKVGRIILYLSFLFFSMLNTLIGNIHIKEYDVVIGSSGPVFTPVYAYIVSRISKIPFILELRDITFVQMLGTFSNCNSLYFKMIKKLELFLCKKATKLIVTTKHFKQILLDHGIAEGKIHIIPNGVSGDEKPEDSMEINIVKSKDEIIFCYAGTLGISQDLIEMIQFFQQVDLLNKKLYIIGDGAEKEKIINYLKKNQLDNIQVLNPMSRQALKSFYKKVDICFVKLKNTPQFSHFIPSKIFDIMYNRKPVLYLGPEGEVTELIDESQSGLYFSDPLVSENAKAFSSYLKSFQNIKELREELSIIGKNGHVYCVKNYNREALAKEYLDIMKRL